MILFPIHSPGVSTAGLPVYAYHWFGRGGRQGEDVSQGFGVELFSLPHWIKVDMCFDFRRSCKSLFFFQSNPIPLMLNIPIVWSQSYVVLSVKTPWFLGELSLLWPKAASPVVPGATGCQSAEGGSERAGWEAVIWWAKKYELGGLVHCMVPQTQGDENQHKST